MKSGGSQIDQALTPSVQTEPTGLAAEVPGEQKQAWGRSHFVALMLIAGTVLLFSRDLFQLMRFAGDSELFSYIRLIPVISAYLAWKSWEKSSGVSSLNRVLSLFLLILGLTGYLAIRLAVSQGWRPPAVDYLAASTTSFVCLISALVLWFGGRQVRFGATFLFLMIPFPESISRGLSIASQHASAEVAYWFIRATGTPIVRGSLKFGPGDVRNSEMLAEKLKRPPEPVSVYIAAKLSDSTKNSLEHWPGSSPVDLGLLRQILEDLNRIVKGPSIWDAERFSAAVLRSNASGLIQNASQEIEVAQLNRLLLEDAFAGELIPGSLADSLTFKLPGITIKVAEECSGIHSSVVLFITAILAGHLFLMRSTSIWIVALLSIPIGIVRNGLRILTIAWLCANVDPEIINGPIHKRGGPPFFVLSLLPLFFLVYYLRSVERRAEVSSGPQLPDAVSNPIR